MDRWKSLLDVVGLDEGVTLEPTGYDTVTVRYEDGSFAPLYWHHDASRWIFAEGMNTSCPCDVAARDSL